MDWIGSNQFCLDQDLIFAGVSLTNLIYVRLVLFAINEPPAIEYGWNFHFIHLDCEFFFVLSFNKQTTVVLNRIMNAHKALKLDATLAARLQIKLTDILKYNSALITECNGISLRFILVNEKWARKDCWLYGRIYVYFMALIKFMLLNQIESKQCQEEKKNRCKYLELVHSKHCSNNASKELQGVYGRITRSFHVKSL